MKLALVVGTRPEAIKMAGLVFELRKQSAIQWHLCATGQHGSMLDETLTDLGLEPHSKLDIMGSARGLPAVTARSIEELSAVVAEVKPDWVLVQGDTTTALAGALAGYYHKIPVGHVEAGLRTGNNYSPWPEEGNRRMIAALTTLHFAPTEKSRGNLLAEGIDASAIEVTGNTVIDALLVTEGRLASDPAAAARLQNQFSWLDTNKRLVVVTGHRRENFGHGLEQICLALRDLAERSDIEIVYPVHLNPSVRSAVNGILSDRAGVHLIEPLSYTAFVYLLMRCHLILTDSGGIQEEAPSLGKPVLVLRDTSERPEAVAAGVCEIVGTRRQDIVAAANHLLDDESAYAARARRVNVYGDGRAGSKIIERLLQQ